MPPTSRGRGGAPTFSPLWPFSPRMPSTPWGEGRVTGRPQAPRAGSCPDSSSSSPKKLPWSPPPQISGTDLHAAGAWVSDGTLGTRGALGRRGGGRGEGRVPSTRGPRPLTAAPLRPYLVAFGAGGSLLAGVTLKQKGWRWRDPKTGHAAPPHPKAPGPLRASPPRAGGSARGDTGQGGHSRGGRRSRACRGGQVCLGGPIGRKLGSE